MKSPSPFVLAFIASALIALAALELRGAEFADGFESEPLTLCERIASHPDVEPAGFLEATRGWGGAGGLFGPGSHYPSPLAAEVYPVGSWTLGNSTYWGSQSTRGRWLSVPITGDGLTYKFEWIQAKPTNFYSPNRPTDFKYVTLSPCPGDFRRTSRFIPDDPTDASLVQQCRNHVIAETGLSYGPTGFGRCIVREGDEVWLNVIWIDASQPGPLDPNSTGCRDQVNAVCETSWRHSRDGQ